MFVWGCGGGDQPAPPAAAEAPTADQLPPDPDAAIDTAVDELIAYADDKRAGIDFAAVPPFSARAGADPFAVIELSGRRLGLLRSGAIVVLDRQARVVRTSSALPGATGIDVVGDRVVVSAEGHGVLQRIDPQTLAVEATVDVEGVASIRDVAWGGSEGRLYLADPHRHRVLSIAWPPEAGRESVAATTVEASCRGASAVQRVGDWLAYDCLLGHRLVVRRVTADGALGPAAAIEHDGPIWSFDAAVDGDGLAIVAGGVEDRPLDRTDGGFGYIDSFAYAYAVTPTDGAPTIARRAATNVAAHGVVTPKVVRWTEAPRRAAVVGYGSAAAVELTWPQGGGEPAVRGHALPPGSTDFVGTLADGVFANPLLDAFVRTEPDASPAVVPVESAGPPRTASERLGEALVFTTLMAPQGISDGKRSRFTCETCHFEGRTDGRTHWTGRGDVHATTKTLRGLFNNRPHFSRALDRTTGKMVHAEFRVANTGTGFDPWFSLPLSDAPWLRHLGVTDASLSPQTLRRAVIDFLAIFTPETNPSVVGLDALGPRARTGMKLFETSCASCHSPRLVADDADTVVRPGQWERHILSASGPLVWGAPTRSKTGVEPLVHRDGPRAPSLRRLWVKRPLLTNGKAATVDEVLANVRLGVDTVHGGGAQGRALTDDERRALGEFLDLL